MHGLNWYDYSARHKDDFRFTTVDPMAEKYYSLSPYTYVANNPTKYIDRDGREILNGLGDRTTLGYKTIEYRRFIGFDNGMIHIYAHASPGGGFSYTDGDGTYRHIGNAAELKMLLNDFSETWRTRHEGEEIFIVLHACRADEPVRWGDGTVESWVQTISYNMPDYVTLVGSNKAIEITIDEENIMNRGKWTFYKQGEKLYTIKGNDKNNPVHIPFYYHPEFRNSESQQQKEKNEEKESEKKEWWGEVRSWFYDKFGI